MRVVHSHQDPRQRGGTGQRQRHSGQPGPQQGQPHRETDGECGVVAGKGPVPRLRALREHLDAGQHPAGPLLIHDQFQRLAERVRDNGAGPDDDGPGDTGHIPAAARGPAHQGEQQPQDHQRPLGGHLKKRTGPRRTIGHGSCQGPVDRHRPPFGDLGRPGLPEPARGQTDDDHGPRPQESHGTEEPDTPGVPS